MDEENIIFLISGVIYLVVKGYDWSTCFNHLPFPEAAHGIYVYETVNRIQQQETQMEFNDRRLRRVDG